jgi:hypothetical protein
MRVFAAIFLTAFLMADAASASSFVVLAPMQEKLGPSMIALGAPAAAEDRTKNAEAGPAPAAPAIATTLDYPYPGGKAPIIRASALSVDPTPLDHPAPPSQGHPKKSAPDYQAAANVRFVKVSSSIIAMADPAVSFEEVSAIDKPQNVDGHSYSAGPMVIRGGIVGNAFGPSPNQPVTVVAPKAAAPASAKKPATSTGARSAASASSAAASTPAAPAKKEEPPVPIPSPTPAPPPANIVPQAKIE